FPYTTLFRSPLKPCVPIRSVIDDKLDDDAQIPIVGRCKELFEIVKRAVARMYIFIIGDVVSIIAQRRWEKGEKPETGDTQILEIVQFLDKAWKVSDSIAITIEERLHVRFVDDRVFVPEWIRARSFDHRSIH